MTHYKPAIDAHAHLTPDPEGVNSQASQQQFELSAPGKWILAGEHSILRGYRGLAMPRSDISLTMKFRSTPLKTQTDSAGTSHIREVMTHESDLSLALKNLKITPQEGAQTFHRILEALHLQDPDQIFSKMSGTLEIIGTIPYGAGLGSSAAFCLLVVRWLSHFMSIQEDDICAMATRLENEFHGKSSGIDVATIYHAKPIAVQLIHQNGQDGLIPKIRAIELDALPKFTFHDTNLRASTRECVQKVQALGIQNPALAKKIDQQMDEAAEKAEQGLVEFAEQHQPQGLKLIADAMQLAQGCFAQWDLVPKEAADLIEDLRKKGALAAKLTGSGGGGIVVALWA